VGGGFGGINVAKRLRNAPVDVTLIDRSNHHLFQPLLYQIATATLSPADIAMPIRHILRKQQNTTVLLAEVSGVDLTNKLVLIGDAAPVPFDYLVLAAGSTHSYFGHPEWEDISRGLKSIDDATQIRGQILSAFEYAELAQTEEEQRHWLTFIIVGAGATGVELAGAISELANRVLAGDFRRINPDVAKIIVVEGGPKVLATYPDDLSARAKRDLERLRVDVRLNTMVQGLDKGGVNTNNGRIEGRTIIWAAGVQASPGANWLGVEPSKSGRIRVQQDVSVRGLSNVFVIGDGAEFEQDGHLLPGVAQVAIQQGKYVADKILADILGRPFDKPFRYKNLGNLATIGRSRAIAEFGKVHFYGWLAWWVWLFVHILNLVGFRNKLSVLLQWGWAYFTWDRGARLITLGDTGSKKNEP
jgi:NADH dehydrogenase